MPRFRKRPVEVEAVQWTGDNEAELVALWFVRERDEARAEVKSERARSATL